MSLTKTAQKFARIFKIYKRQYSNIYTPEVFHIRVYLTFFGEEYDLSNTSNYFLNGAGVIILEYVNSKVPYKDKDREYIEFSIGSVNTIQLNKFKKLISIKRILYRNSFEEEKTDNSKPGLFKDLKVNTHVFTLIPKKKHIKGLLIEDLPKTIGIEGLYNLLYEFSIGDFSYGVDCVIDQRSIQDMTLEISKLIVRAYKLSRKKRKEELRKKSNGNK